MSPILLYLLKAAVCSGILFAYYCLALRNQRQHRWNRVYLLGLTGASLILPLLRIPLPGGTPDSAALFSYSAAAFDVGNHAQQSGFSTLQWACTGYAFIAILLLVRFGYAIWQLRRLIRGGRIQEGPNYRLILHPSVPSPFSFFRFIFWNPGTEQLSPESRHMLQHEQVHVRKGHSWDTIFMELVTALCWANPFFHFVKKELSVVHEFEADEAPAGNGQQAEYAENLLRQALHAPSAHLFIHHFSQPPVKRRIMMLTRNTRPRYAAARKLMALPLAAGLLFAVSCVQKDEANITAQEKQVLNAPRNEIFTEVEQPPTFAGGTTAMNKYLSESIKYPENAVKNGVSGTIFVTFIIRADGSIDEVKTIGDKVGSGLEEESIRVVREMPKWKPGVQNGRKVDVLFNIPIRYTLQEQESEKTTSFWPVEPSYWPGKNKEC